MYKNENDKRRYTIAVIGDARVVPGSEKDIFAESVGKMLADEGHRVLTGGMGGVMEAAHRGARSSTNWRDGTCIGLLPGSNPASANPYVDVVIPTGLDHVRNMVVAQSDAVVAIGGGAGTLTEMAFAWIHRRLIIGANCDGWSKRLAGQRIDNRVRYPDVPEDKVYEADSADIVVALLSRWLPFYNGYHKSIK
ncbi:TIGR00725 family protein [Desulfosediminicola sp.]|uniref:TIGR00725 family protein n=1 Tax=Desulfosediminicola sp. TaxID=2886825 RepID=UPI003AF218DE